MTIKTMPQLLSPAGNMECVRAAVNCGCNAIYAGGKQYSARSSADNFTVPELLDVIDYCHLRGVQVYIAVNTLYKQSELKDIFAFVDDMYCGGADAFIVQDIGVASFIRENFPGVNLHASTQMSARSLSDVRYLEEAGFDRVVLARELSIEDIREIRAGTEAELEVFVHGALCVCYSGQCLMSGMIGRRSGNRGECAQPCRLKYNLQSGSKSIAQGYLLSTKDLMTADILRDIATTGVDCFKIEGRMKSPNYVALATKEYRDAIDGVHMGGELAKVFNRGGEFTSGYFMNHSGIDMMSTDTPKNTGVLIGRIVSTDGKARCEIETKTELVPGDGLEIWTQDEPHPGGGVNVTVAADGRFSMIVKTPSHETSHTKIRKGDPVYRTFDKTLHDRLKRLCERDNRKTVLTGTVTAIAGKLLELQIIGNGVAVKVSGCIVEKANKSPLTMDELLRRLSKTGDTPFKLHFNAQDCEIGGNIYISIQDINNLRREAVKEYTDALLRSTKRESTGAVYNNTVTSRKSPHKRKISVIVNTAQQLKIALGSGIDRIYMEASGKNTDFQQEIEQCHRAGVEFFAALPRIEVSDEVERLIALLEQTDVDGYLVRAYGQLLYLKSTGNKIIVDYGLHIFNELTTDYYTHRGFESTISPELDYREAALLEGEFIIYGRLPLMLTRQCPVGLYAGRKGNERHCKLRNNADNYSITDRKDAEYRIESDCDACAAMIMSPAPISIPERYIVKSAATSLRLIFTNESQYEVQDLLEKAVSYV